MSDTDFKYVVSLASNEAWKVLRELEEAGLRFQIEVDPSVPGGSQVGLYIHLEDYQRGLEMTGLAPAEDDGFLEEWIEEFDEEWRGEEPLPDFDETPVESGMTLNFSDKSSVRNPTTGDIFRALEVMEKRAGTFLTLGDGETDFIEVGGDPGVGFTLELRSADPQKRFRSQNGDLSLTVTFNVLVGFLRQTNDWPTLVTWEKASP